MDHDALVAELARLTKSCEELVAAVRDLSSRLSSTSGAGNNWQAEDTQATRDMTEPSEALPTGDSPARVARPGDAVKRWFSGRGIIVREASLIPPATDPLVRLATELGQNFDVLQSLHDGIRRNLQNGGKSHLNLSGLNSVSINKIVTFATKMNKQGLLSDIYYNKGTKVLTYSPSSSGGVQNFFAGGWFETYVGQRVLSAISASAHDVLINLKLTLGTQEERELDIFCLVEGEPMWVECKSGDYSQHLQRMTKLAKELGIPPDRLLLAALQLQSDALVTIPQLYRFRAANLATLDAQLAQMLPGAARVGDEAFAAGAAPVLQNLLRIRPEPGKLGTFLGKWGLRPVPQVRGQVLALMPVVVRDMSAPRTPFALKEALYLRLSQCGLSKSAITDALAAAFRGGALVDEDGVEVTHWKMEFNRLVSENVAELERCCRRAYLEAILRADPGWFEDRNAGQEFAETIGGPAPSLDEVGVVLALIQQKAAERMAQAAD